MYFGELKAPRNGRIVVFGGTKEARELFAKRFLEVNDEFTTDVLPFLFNVKKPLFGKYKSACEVMAKQVDKSRREFVYDLLVRECKHLDMDAYIDRAPRSLSLMQKMRWSLLYHVITGKRDFLLHDETDKIAPKTADMFEAWAAKFAGKVMNVVRVTGRTGEALDEMLAEGDVCYEIKGNELVEYTKPEPQPEPVEVPPVHLKRTHRVPKTEPAPAPAPTPVPKHEPAPTPNPTPAPAPAPAPEQAPKSEPELAPVDRVKQIMAMRNAYLKK